MKNKEKTTAAAVDTAETQLFKKGKAIILFHFALFRMHSSSLLSFNVMLFFIIQVKVFVLFVYVTPFLLMEFSGRRVESLVPTSLTISFSENVDRVI